MGNYIRLVTIVQEMVDGDFIDLLHLKEVCIDREDMYYVLDKHTKEVMNFVDSKIEGNAAKDVPTKQIR